MQTATNLPTGPSTDEVGAGVSAVAPSASSPYPETASTQAAPQAPHASLAPIVRIDRVSKRYPGVQAVRGVSLNIQQGEIFGLLGPNGAGKSTLLKLLLGFLNADSGTVKLFGSTDLTQAHSRIGYLPEQPRYHGNFTGREYIEFQGRLAGLSARDARTITTRALKLMGIEEAANRRIRTYSKGMRQRLGLAVALSAGGDAPPELLILDEPASGLAPEGQVAVREVLLECKRQGSTILLCSHQLTEVERICSQVGILRGGRLVALTRLDDHSRVTIMALPRPRALEVAPHLIEYLRGLHPSALIKGGTREDEPLVVSLPTGNGVPNAPALKAAAMRAMIDARWDITSVHIENRDLESIYLQAVSSTRTTDDGRRTTVGNGQSAGPEEPGPSSVVHPGSAPLPVRPASSNGAARGDELGIRNEELEIGGYTGGDSIPNSSSLIPNSYRSGPSTAPLPPLPPDALPTTAETPQAPRDPWLADLRREGEER